MIWEIDIHAASPEEAALQARAAQLTLDLPATIFGVWDHANKSMHRIDVGQHAERLDPAELVAIRASLRSLQCGPVQAGLKDLVSAMLIFLDREDTILKHVRSQGSKSA